tara:strand:+ start:8742 stop:9386 length:645 start_codon:yes stop_codon:yes gene_type:complete
MTKRKPSSVNGDPLRLQASGKERRKEATRREDLQRRHLSYLLKMKSVTPDMYRAAVQLHEWSLISRGGMQAMDWLREKVDGGKGGAGIADLRGGVLDADRKLKGAFRDSGISTNQIEIVLMVICNEESLNAVADVLAARPGAALRPTDDEKTKRGYVGALLRDALSEIHKCLYAPNHMDAKSARMAIRRWMADDAMPTDRPDLRAVSAKHHDAA